MTDLLSLKQDFCEIVTKAQPWILSHFIMWLDLKVAEYKVYGYMVLEQSTNLTGDTKDPAAPASSLTPSPNKDPPSSPPSSQHFSPRAPCLVVPRPNLSTDRTPTSSAAVIPTATTPIFKRPLFGGRANRRKQQHVFRRSSTSLLTALSSDIYNTVGIERRDGEERRNPSSVHLQDSDLSITSSVSQSGDTQPSEGIDSSHGVSQSEGSSNTSTAQGEDQTRSIRDLFTDRSDTKRRPSTDDMEVLSSQYGVMDRSSDCIVVDVSDDKNTVHGQSEDKNAPESMQVGTECSGAKDNDSPSCDTQCSSSLPEFNSKSSSSSSNSSRSHTESSPEDPVPLTASQIKQEDLGGLQIKLEPVDPSQGDLYYPGAGSGSASGAGSLLHQHLSYPGSSVAGPAYLESIDWNAVNFNRYLDSSFSNESTPTSSHQIRPRSGNVSPASSTKSDPALTCNLCGAVFRFKSSLSRHKTLHGEKRFHCFVCPKAFHRREHLLLHLQRHANSAMITCPVCHMQASSVKHLEEHYRLNHGPFKRTGVLPYLAQDNSR